MMHKVVEGDVFKPGDIVERSGVYRVFHASQHADTHEVTAVYQTPFPECLGCGQDVRFELLHGARIVDQAPNFKP